MIYAERRSHALDLIPKSDPKREILKSIDDKLGQLLDLIAQQVPKEVAFEVLPSISSIWAEKSQSQKVAFGQMYLVGSLQGYEQLSILEKDGEFYVLKSDLNKVDERLLGSLYTLCYRYGLELGTCFQLPSSKNPALLREQAVFSIEELIQVLSLLTERSQFYELAQDLIQNLKIQFNLED